MGGRYNSLQMEREGDYSEHAYRNNFEKGFDVLKFNKELIKQNTSRDIIIAFDPSYIAKIGKHIPGVGYFYSG
jgi:hypothetical protein